MPQADSRLLDLRTSSIADRLAATDDVVEAAGTTCAPTCHLSSGGATPWVRVRYAF